MTAGTPSLNRPLPDRSEAEARIERALKVARDGRAAGNGAETSHAHAVISDITLGQIISILDGKPTNGG